MLKRKPILIAIAAAGLLRGEGLRDAYSEDVFVPELAALDGTFCGTATSIFRGLRGILLAQAGKTEVGPAAPAAAAAMPAASETDAHLQKGDSGG